MGLLARRLAVAVLVQASTLLGVTPCRADGLIIEVPNLSVAPGSSGSFDVLLFDSDPAGSAGYNLAASSLQLSLSGSAGSSIQFANATIDTVSAPYIFTQSLDGDYGLPLFTNPLPDMILMTSDAGDVAGGYPGYTTVNPGDTFGLANVSYTVSPGAVVGSSDSIALVLTNGATSLADPNGDSIPFAAGIGSFGVVPEPTTLTLGTSAALIVLGAFWWRRQIDRRAK